MKYIKNLVAKHGRTPIFSLKMYSLEDCIALYHALALYYKDRIDKDGRMIKLVKELSERLKITIATD